jgi:Zn-dependent protease with chaperone function
MKNYIILLSFLLSFVVFTNAQVPQFSCEAIVAKNLSAKESNGENLKIKENEKIEFISWKTNIVPNDEIDGLEQSAYPELIVQYQDRECSIGIKDLKKVKFEEPTNKKEFWEIFTLEHGVIQNLAKNGLRYDLRGELDEESIEFLSMMSRNNLIYKDEFIEDYVQSLVFKIHPGQLNDKRPGTINLIIYNESNPNAFSLPNGSICISTGLLSVVESEEELIGVLAHETTHFVGDHHVNNIIEMVKRAQRAEFWAGVATAMATVADAYLAAKNEYYEFGALSYSTAVISSEIAFSMLERFGINYNYEQEFAADEAAFDVMKFLDKKPEAYVSALNKIANYAYRTGNYAALSNSHTHPSLDSRLAALKVDPTDFYSEDYQVKMSFVNTNNAKIEFNKKHFIECKKLVDKNINAGVGTEDDLILKAMVTRLLYGDKEHNLLALEYLNKAEELGIEPNSYVFKQRGITYMRMEENLNAKSSFESYLNELSGIYNESGDMSFEEIQSLKNEISWTKRMIFKSGV